MKNVLVQTKKRKNKFLLKNIVKKMLNNKKKKKIEEHPALYPIFLFFSVNCAEGQRLGHLKPWNLGETNPKIWLLGFGVVVV